MLTENDYISADYFRRIQVTTVLSRIRQLNILHDEVELSFCRSIQCVFCIIANCVPFGHFYGPKVPLQILIPVEIALPRG
jgi:hypothetical protein